MSTGTTITKVTVKLSVLVFDYTIYPRHKVSEYHVNQLIEAKLGGADFPPVVLDKKTKRIIDGFHRATAYKKLYGVDYELEVELLDCNDEKEVILASIEYNSKHGLPLSTWDKKRCITLMAEVGIKEAIQMQNLSITEEKYKKLQNDIVEIRNELGKKVGVTQLKFGQNNLAKKENERYVTQKEAEIIESGNTTGLSPEIRISTLIKDFNMSIFMVTSKNVKKVRELYELIGEALAIYEEEIK
ncbi:MAG: hypothetical protein WC346_16480 [Methanogenium sp.]|jgi:hypothetical protein